MIPLMKVNMPPRDRLLPKLEEVLYSGTVTEGEQVREFERQLKSTLRLHRHPIATNNCTSALQIAYRCCDVENKIVLTTPMTCTATTMPILAERGHIVWCDIDPDTGNISTNDVVKKIEKYGAERIAAISFVDFAGYPANLEVLASIGDYYETWVIEDAAQSIGARYQGMFIGGHEGIDFITYSFQAIKHMTTGDGGALITPRSEEDRAKRLKWYGIDRDIVKEATRWHYDIPEYGYKAHMNNIAAAIGLVQLETILSVVEKHRWNGQWFNRELSDIGGLDQLKIPGESEPSYWIYMVKVDGREDFARMMTDKGIGVNVAHIRNDEYSCFSENPYVMNTHEERPGLEEFNDKYIGIPCGWWLNQGDREYIRDTIRGGW